MRFHQTTWSKGFLGAGDSLNKSPQVEKHKARLVHSQRLSLIGATSGERLRELRLICSPAVGVKEHTNTALEV